MNESRPRVFIVDHSVDGPERDISHAQNYGDIVPVFDRKSDRSSIWSDSFKGDILRMLRVYRYSPTEDFILIAGKIVPLTIVLSVVQCEYGAMQVLQFDCRDSQYQKMMFGEEYEDDSRSESTLQESA